MTQVIDDQASAQTRPSTARRHDDVDLLERLIQRIFSAGMLLQAARADANTAAVASIEEAVAELDAALRDIRAEVFTAAAGRSRVIAAP